MSQFNLNESKRTDGKFLLFMTIIFLFIGLSGQTQQQPKTITLTLSVEEVETVLSALNEVPYKTSAPLIQKIITQGNAQLTPPSPAPDTTGKKKEEPKNKKQ